MTKGAPPFPSGLGEQLAALARNGAPIRISQLAKQAEILSSLCDWTRETLARCHLVTVASFLKDRLASEPAATLDDLRTVGVPVDSLEQFPHWRENSRAGFRPRGLGLRPAPVGADKHLKSLRLQLSPSSETIPFALKLIRDLLRIMDHSVRITVVVEPGANLAGLRDLAGGFGSEASERIRFVESRCITIFAQDNARPAQSDSGEPVLLIPRAFRTGDLRAQDELSAEEAAGVLGMRVLRSQLYWEGGNILQDAERCLVGADTVVENMRRLGLTLHEVLA